jgi:hypothetical protein
VRGARFLGACNPLIQRYFLGVFRFAKMAPTGSRMTGLGSVFTNPIQAIDWMEYFRGISFCQNRISSTPQRERFTEAARKIGVDETGKEFERLFDKVVKVKKP